MTSEKRTILPLCVSDERGGRLRQWRPNRHREFPHAGELYAIYIRDKFQRHGIGKRLFCALANRLFSVGIRVDARMGPYHQSEPPLLREDRRPRGCQMPDQTRA
ncbi:GNAT family N-acetyltransferase [Chelativorans sp.]|uniref:GNAT family N-acetyltransferase n=1 Tax=Chelativorans sp. TaxID=2203393 RepID=UPI0035C6EF3A